MLMDGRTDGQTHDGRKVITIAHPEQSSGELKIQLIVSRLFGLVTTGCHKKSADSWLSPDTSYFFPENKA